MEPVTIERDLDLDLPLDEAWSLVADGDGLASWFADEVDVVIATGEEGTVVDDGVTHAIRIDRVIPEREVTFTWWTDAPADASTVVIELQPDDRGGSRVHITETMGAAASELSATLSAALRWGVRTLLLGCASATRSCVAV